MVFGKLLIDTIRRTDANSELLGDLWRDWHDDCDLQFIPTDAKRLISLYDSLLWKPTPVEFERMIH